MKLQFQNMHRGGKSGSRKEPFNKLLQAEAVCAFKFKVFFDTVIEKLEMMWQFYGLILIEAKICLPTTVIKLGKKCLKAEFTREIAQFLFCYKIWWYLRHEGIQEMANDRWIKHFRHSRASWVIQLALWRRRLATTTSEVVTRL